MRALVLGLLTFAGCGSGRHEVGFDKRVLDARFLTEGVAVFDVDRDGKLDIVAGEQWFHAPEFSPRLIGTVTPLDPATQYSTSFINYPMDVDGDGWTDQVGLGFPLYPAFWRKNPGGGDGPWAEHLLWGGAAQESPRVERLSATTAPVAIFHPDGRNLGLFSPGADPTLGWTPRLLPLPDGVDGLAPHGLGIGDLDGDGRVDLLTPRGFWSMPAASDDAWPFTAADLGPDCAQMHVFDVNGDGLADVVTSSAHGVGVFWHEQVRSGGAIAFVRHTISEAFSQSHALEVADLNGDGLTDLVTGKRMWAHGPQGDIDPDAPKVLYWFELQRDGKTARFVPHVIDDDSGVGTQFVVTDVNGDRRPDIVTSNKRGLAYFQQR
jgi:hypothetical protein